MRKLLLSFIVLLFTPSVYAMEDDHTILTKLGMAKAQLDTFHTKTLDEQKQLLIEVLQHWREAKHKAKLYVCDKAKIELPEYNGFEHLNTKNFLPTTVLEFSEKTLQIQEITSEEILRLIKHAINDGSIHVLKAKVSRGVAGYDAHINEDVKQDRHGLVWAAYIANLDYKEKKTQAYSQIQCNLQSILEKDPLKFKILKTNPTNKKKEIKLCLKKARASNLLCLRVDEVKDLNLLCSEKCVLQTFTDFSNEEMFDFYRITKIKEAELDEIKISYQSQILGSIVSSVNAFVPQEQQRRPVHQLTVFYNPPQPSAVQLKRYELRQKLENKEQNTKNTKQQLSPSEKEESHSPIQKNSQIQALTNPQTQTENKPKHKKQKNRQPQTWQQKPQATQTQNRGGQVRTTNDSSSSIGKGSSLPPSNILTKIDGQTAAIGASEPYDGKGGFIPANAKKQPKPEPQTTYQNTNRGRGRGQGRYQANERKTSSHQAPLPVKSPELPQVIQPQPVTKAVSYSAMVQNRAVPETWSAATTKEENLKNDKPALLNESTISLRPSIQNVEAYRPLTLSNPEKKKTRSFLENPTGEYLPSNPPPVVQFVSDNQDKAETIREEKVDQKLTVTDQSQSSVPSPNFEGAVHYGFETFEIADSPTIEKILIQRDIMHRDNKQRDIMHIYAKGYGELAKISEQKSRQLEKEKELRQKAEQELEELRKKLAQREAEK